MTHTNAYTQTAEADRFMRLPEVERVTGLKRSTLYEKVSRREFPGPYQLSERAVAWLESEVTEWRKQRPKVSAAA